MPAEYAVCVSFVLKPQHRLAFVARVRQQACDTLAEPGCRVFDVWTDETRPNEVFLYETYDGEAAFEDHLRTDHTRAFEHDVADWVEAKHVLRWSRREPIDG